MFRFKQIVTGTVFALVALAIVIAPVGAGRSWCRTDPIVRLGDTEYQLIVAIPYENVPQVDGALLFEISSPAGTEQELLFVDSGYNGYGEEVTFSEHASMGSHLFTLDVQQTGTDFLVMVEVYVDGKLVSKATGTSRGMQVPLPIVNTGFINRAG